MGLWTAPLMMYRRGLCSAARRSSMARSGPSGPRGTPTGRAPNAARRPKMTNHAGSSTSTVSPGLIRWRATMSRPCVTPLVVSRLRSGWAGTPSACSMEASCWRSGA
ncbi:Uncharacterised protein [Bordetella pertussis]|nr:Uncharacterised protein [Bordetella pertussis]